MYLNPSLLQALGTDRQTYTIELKTYVHGGNPGVEGEGSVVTAGADKTDPDEGTLVVVVRYWKYLSIRLENYY